MLPATLLAMDRATTGGRRRIGVAVVRGESMGPALRPGQRLLVLYGGRVRPGKIVVARFADGTLAVKRVAGRRGDAWWLLSDNADAGVDSRHRGAVPDADVAGVVRARVWPWPRPL